MPIRSINPVRYRDDRPGGNGRLQLTVLPLTPTKSIAVRYDDKKRKVNGYIALWGNENKRDCVGTWFDRDNPPNLGLGYNRNDYSTFLPMRIMIEHGADGKVKRAIVGRVTRIWNDDIGIAFEGELDDQGEHYDYVLGKLEDGKYATSTGSAQHLAEFTEDGRFDDWILAELTFTENPCEETMPSVQVRSRLAAQRARARGQKVSRYRVWQVGNVRVNPLYCGAKMGVRRAIANRRRAFTPTTRNPIPKSFDIITGSNGQSYLIVDKPYGPANQPPYNYIVVPWNSTQINLFDDYYTIATNLLTSAQW